MKKITLVLLTILTVKCTIAQTSIPLPNIAQFESYKNKELNGAIKYAEELYGLKINLTEYKAIGKSEIFSFQREDSKGIYGWPDDGCAVRYYYENPKVSNGIKAKLEVVVEFKRSTCTASDCVLENTWSAYVVNVIPNLEDVGLTKLEAENLSKLCMQSSYTKTQLLKDFIEISTYSPYTYDEANPDYHYTKIVDAQTVEFRVKLKGTLGAFTNDKSIFLAEQTRDDFIDFYLKNENGKWIVVGSNTSYSESFSSNDKSLLDKEIPVKRYARMEEKGLDVIYQKRMEEATPPNNPINSLMNSANEFSNIIASNISSINKEALRTYFETSQSENESSVNQSLENLSQISISNPSIVLKEGMVNDVKFVNYEEETIDNKLVIKASVKTKLSAKEFTLKGKKEVDSGNIKEIYLILNYQLTETGWKIVDIQS